MPILWDRKRNRYVRAARGLLGSALRLSFTEIRRDNEVWEEWLNHTPRRFYDLRVLMNSDVRPAFKARALAIMLAPHRRLVPFAWRDQDGSSITSYAPLVRLLGDDRLMFEEFTPRLRDFAFALLELNINTAKGSEKELVRTYNYLIQKALSLLDVDDPRAQTFFDLYQLQDAEDRGRYKFFESLLFSADVPEVWKQKLDARMVGHISTLMTESVSFGDEPALSSYVYILERYISSATPPYSRELFVRQLLFSLCFPRTRMQIARYHTAKLFSLIQGEALTELRRALARRLLLESEVDHSSPHSPFSIRDRETLETAEALLAEFGSEPKLRLALEAAIVAGGSWVRKNEDLQENRREATERLAARMR